MGSVSNSNPLTSNTVFKDCSQGICSIYCPQWCYTIYSPPPPSFILGDDDDESSGFQFSPLIIAVIGILASTFILVTYYTLFSRFCRNRGSSSRINDPTTQNAELGQVSSSSGLDETLIKSITVCKYKKSGVFIEGSDCSVCLSEFEENESLRLLPKCNHAFHLPCIDPWLKSHSTCPLCRSNISFTRDSNNIPTILMEAPAPASMNVNALEYQQRSGDVVVVIQNSEPSISTQNEDVAISFGDTKWPVEGADDDGENIEELDGNVRRVSVLDILNEGEHDVGSSRGNEGDQQSEENGKGIRVVNVLKRCASTGRSMLTRYGSSKGMNSVLPN